MSKRMEPPAGTQCKRDQLRRIYLRQFEELASLRQHICNQLPLRQAGSVYEPGCGTGLLGKELKAITNGVYTGVDVDYEILPDSDGFLTGDAEENPLPADIYVTSFFFSSLKNPLKWLKKVRKKLAPGGLFAVFAEYDYSHMVESPVTGIADSLRSGLEKDGIKTTNGARLDFFFEKAGFFKITGGEVLCTPQEPDRSFIEMHTENLPEKLPLMSWRIVWGIWRRN